MKLSYTKKTNDNLSGQYKIYYVTGCQKIFYVSKKENS
jgi:hypothetical protein